MQSSLLSHNSNFFDRNFTKQTSPTAIDYALSFSEWGKMHMGSSSDLRRKFIIHAYLSNKG